VKPHYIICDGQGYRSMNDKDEPEEFSTFRGKGGAQKRAEQIAAQEPGTSVYIYEAVAVAEAPVGAPQTGRKYPTEHYK